jgi:WD40 repeat protein
MKTALLITLLVSFASASLAQDSSAAQKKEFIDLLKTLPTKGEFYTDESIRRATPYLPALLSLTEDDIEKYDFYPLAAISGGLAREKTNRAYVLKRFAEIRHPQLKLFWAAMLFNADDISPEVVHYLRDALKEPSRAKTLSEAIGPDFKFFKRKVLSHPYANDGRVAEQMAQDEGHADWVSSVAFSPDGKTLVSGSHDGTLILWDVATGKQIRSIEDHRLHGRPFEVVSVAFSPDGQRVASASSDQTVRVWEAATGTPVWKFSNVKSAHEVRFSPDGNRLAVANCETVLVWNLSTGTLIRTIPKAQTGIGGRYCAEHVAFLGDGSEVLADGGPIQIWQTSTGREVRRFSPQGSGFAMALSRDGTKILLGEDFNGYRGMMELWDVTKGILIRSFPEQSNPVDSVAFSPDGKTVASESRDGDDIESDGFIKLWDLTTGKELRKLAGHKRRVAAIAFAPDGKTLASGSWDHSVKLWDVASGKEIRSLPSATSPKAQ